jgi:hypothetical protein
MNDLLSDIFGVILIAAAIVLAAWEVNTFRNAGEDRWLVTRRRCRRRLLVSAVLAVIGLLLTLEARKIIPTERVGVFVVFAAIVTGLSVFLLILAGIDVLETVNSATKQSLNELDRAIRDQKRDPEPTQETRARR